MVTIAERALDEGLAVTDTVTLPLPAPELPAVIVAQPALLTAVQEQPVPAVTAIEVVPAVAATDTAVVESE
jgi:hypothetical protein